MTRLSVNVNKLATLRNSRGKDLPNVGKMAQKILSYGVHGITVHPRPDERHIRAQDVLELHKILKEWNSSHVKAEFNIEGFPSAEFIQMVNKIRPDQATLVPDPPEALTSNAGWDLIENETKLKQVLKELHPEVRVSLFVDPASFDDKQAAALARIRPHSIELYTERFSDAFSSPERARVTAEYVRVATWAQDRKIGVNAGHDLNQENLGYLVSQIPWLHEVSIGHALMCEALEQGMQTTIAQYLLILEGGV